MKRLEECPFEIPPLVFPGPDDKSPALTAREPLDEWRDSEGVVLGSTGTVDNHCVVRVNGISRFIFDLDSTPVFAVPEPGANLESVKDVYDRVALPLVLQARGTQVIHASANLTPSGALMICGTAGAGKSTICYGLAMRGYDPLADDAVAFRAIGGRIASHPMPFRVRLRSDAARRFLVKDDSGVPSPPSAARPHPPTIQPTGIALGILLSSTGLTNSEIEVSALTRAPELLTALLPHAYSFDLGTPGHKRKMIDEYLNLAVNVPFYSVRLGPGLDAIDQRLDAIESLIHDS